MIKKETLAFQKILPGEQNRFEDRVSFLYLEYAKVCQIGSGVVALSSDRNNDDPEGLFYHSTIQLPVAGISLLSLGPGTSITNAALTSCARSGCVVQFTGGGGFPENSTIIPYTSTSKYAIAQASIVSNPTNARKVAKLFYKKQFGIEEIDGSITQMRGFEGSLIKKIYASESRKQSLKNWRRNTKSEDQVNIALNIANGLMYGLCSSLVQALSMSPALGIIHRGNPKSFLFDLADLYKPTLIIPEMFDLAHEPIEDIPKLTRLTLRRTIHNNNIMKDLSKFLIETFEPYTPENNEDRLIGVSDEVKAHKNYGR